MPVSPYHAALALPDGSGGALRADPRARCPGAATSAAPRARRSRPRRL